ncbi:hypothetical protein FRB97_006634 [Tulasnella sp. 331]|nr:hypothetical protein FRB97_006634 [Tulasnella sp. 331]
MMVPPEIWLLIIEELVKPSHPSAYRPAPGRSKSALQLCLVNRLFKDLVEPLLYSRVYIIPKNLESFKRVFLAETINPEGPRFCATSKAKNVKSLGIIDFHETLTPDQCDAISNILFALQFSLERLLFDLVLTYQGVQSLGQSLTRINGAMRGMQRLRELCFLRPYTAFFDPSLGALLAKGTIERLLIFGVSVYHKIPVPNPTGAARLHRLILAFPYIPRSSVVHNSGGRQNITQTLEMAEHLLLVMPENIASQRSIQGMEGIFGMEAAHGASGRSKIEVTERRLSPLIESVVNGDVWSVQRMTWDMYLRRSSNQ